jgi:hypothetical protein
VFGVWCLVFGVWCLVFGVWCLVFGVWCLVFGGNIFGWTLDERQSFTILDAFVDASDSLIDTAAPPPRLNHPILLLIARTQAHPMEYLNGITYKAGPWPAIIFATLLVMHKHDKDYLRTSSINL